MIDIPNGYKQTEVGVIPEDWEVRQLKDFITIKSGFAFSSKHFSDNGPILLTPGNFKLEGGLYFNERNTKHYSGPYSTSMIFDYNDLLIVMTDLTPDCNLLGKPAFIKLHEPILHNQRIGKIITRNKRFALEFLYWFFLSDSYTIRMKETATGSTVRHTSNGSIYSSLIAHPPTKAEQEAIAEALSDADALIESLEQLIAKKRHLKQAAMQELLTGKKRLPGLSGRWEVLRLGDVADPNQKWSFTGGPFGSNLKSSDYTDDGVRIIQLQNIGDGLFHNNYAVFTSPEKADELLSCNIYPGEIILSKMGDPVARACLIPPHHERYLMCSDGIRLAVNQKRFNTYFVYVSINAPDFRTRAENAGTGSTRKRIGLTELRNLELLCPELPEQTAIATILSDMDAEIATLETKLAKTRQIKQGMMQELLTGKTRLM